MNESQQHEQSLGKYHKTDMTPKDDKPMEMQVLNQIKVQIRHLKVAN